MSKAKFTKPESNPLLNPVDYFNFFGSFISIFEGMKDCNIKSESEVCLLDPENLDPKDLNYPTFVLNKSNMVETVKRNKYDIAVGSKISKFMLLTAVRFKGAFQSAIHYVSYDLMKQDIPYIRVGKNYFKVIKKVDRYNATQITLKDWSKDEIKQDHGAPLLQRIYKFDDFTIIPNNINHIAVSHDCYNLYARMPHTPVDETVTESDIPVTLHLLNHIFGEQVQHGLRYFKVLYEHPKQILPVLSLVSTERETGKTTFLNYIQMMFGENSTIINPNDLVRDFNDSYATKNIIMIDETTIEKTHTIEKLKSIATAKTMSVSQKFISHYTVPFFGKVILCTNKETDFMRIDPEEIRFWVRKIKTITGRKNTNIESDLFNEIPKFLRYLLQLPSIDFSKSRMVFTQEEIATESLEAVKKDSRSTIHKDLDILIEDYFNNHEHIDHFEATAKDIKEKWFPHNNQYSISYIRKVIKDEMKFEPQPLKRYNPFNNHGDINSISGRPFLFKSNRPSLARPETFSDTPLF
jgi:hypothetical protein